MPHSSRAQSIMAGSQGSRGLKQLVIPYPTLRKQAAMKLLPSLMHAFCQTRIQLVEWCHPTFRVTLITLINGI